MFGAANFSKQRGDARGVNPRANDFWWCTLLVLVWKVVVSVLLPIRVSRVIKFLGTTVLAPLLAALNYWAPPDVVKLKNISYALFLCGNIKAKFFF